MKLKILLVNPLRVERFKREMLYLLENTSLLDMGSQINDYGSYPLEVIYIGKILKDRGYEVDFIDAQVRRIPADNINYSRYDVVITQTVPYSKWRCPQAEYRHAISVLTAAKKYKPDIKTIIYGSHCSIFPNLFSEYADCVVIGEPEGVILEAVEGEEKFVKVDEIRLPKVLDAWGIPAFELLDFDIYNARYIFGVRGRLGTLAGSRGCPYNCSFCLKVMIPKKIRFHTPETTVKMAEILVKKYKCVALSWQDLTFTLNKHWTKEVCRGLEKLMVPYAIWTRSDCIDADIAYALAKSGCYFVGLGIESANNEILIKGYNKGYTWEVSEMAVNLLKEAGIPIVGGFQMLFGPYETKSSIKETLTKCRRLNIDDNYSIATPYPMTELWYMAEREGKVPPDLNSWDDVVEVILNIAGTVGNDFTRQQVINFVRGYSKNISHLIPAGIRYYKYFGLRNFVKKLLKWLYVKVIPMNRC